MSSSVFSKFSLKHMSSGQKSLAAVCGSTLLATGGLAYALDSSVRAELPIKIAHYPWEHKKLLSTFDAAALRRGFEVYKQVCATCHTMRYVAFRHMKDIFYTEAEVKKLAAEFQVIDGPDNDGQMFKRPCKPNDYFPSPFENDVIAKNANNGVVPPDFSYIVLAREEMEDHIFHILTGYSEDVPAGMSLPEGAHFNPYYPGGAIAMAPPLYDGVIEYEDGTPATMSQCAKDVTEFLTWLSMPEHDERKLLGLKALMSVAILAPIMFYLTRFRFSTLKTRKIVFTPRK